MFADFDAKLPEITQMLIDASVYHRSFWFFSGAPITGIIMLIAVLLKTRRRKIQAIMPLFFLATVIALLVTMFLPVVRR